MNDIWQLLGLDGPTDDLRAIKRAYAKAIKVARPDEHPEQFQEINLAYKEAQRRARHLAEEGLQIDPVNDEGELTDLAPELKQGLVDTGSTDDPQDPVGHCQLQEHNEPESLNPQADEEDEHYDEMRESFSDLLERVDSLLGRFTALGLVENWRFVERSPYLLDDEFNWQFSMALFERILQHNHKYKDSVGRRLRNPEVFIYLDQFVDWRGREAYLYENFGEANCRPYLLLLRLHTRNEDPLEMIKGGDRKRRVEVDEVANLHQHVMAQPLGRLFSLVFDVGLVFGIYLLALELYPAMGQSIGEFLLHIIATVILMTVVMESTRLRGSPGKLIMGYRVVNSKMAPIPWWQNIWRIFWLGLSLIGIKITIWINLFLDGNLIHDRLSRSRVLDLRSSMKMEKKRFEVDL